MHLFASNDSKSWRFCALRPIYTEKFPVAAHDSLFVLLRPGVAVPSRARAQNYPIEQNKPRIVRGYSWQLLSVDWPLVYS